ncbi:pyridoxal phosphate-dependent decarboxylase family protein [Paraflavitalea speifideaquila]|uniref:pyridoxal phosphate-dependent decarboxylase family protein n=1 Tax=Paraflavitalea speifideaquila TaxID=3076558 RepID=UPI0028F0776F|nr:pyridoxal-dependent decarboxylase [Paraflavitalea speifideiaquila]
MITKNEKYNSSQHDPADWSPTDFAAYGHHMIEKIREYFESMKHRPVWTPFETNEWNEIFEAPMPANPESFLQIADDTWNFVIPGNPTWQHPGFHGFFNITASYPSILAELLSASININAVNYTAAPAAARLEKLVLIWMGNMLGLSPSYDSLLMAGGSSLGNFYALAAAREQVLGSAGRVAGMTTANSAPLRLYTTRQAHSSVTKAAIALGIGTDNVIMIPVDTHECMDIQALKHTIITDRSNGLMPFAVVVTIGSTTIASIDPINSVAVICREENVWLHADAAYGGFWRIVPGLREAIGDLSVADSVVASPTKSLFISMDGGALYVKRKGALQQAFKLNWNFLETDAAEEPMDLSLQLGRAFRSLKLWWVLRSFGLSGIQRHMTHAVTQAAWFTEEVAKNKEWKVVNNSMLPVVCICHQHPLFEQSVQMIIEAVNNNGRWFITAATFRKNTVIRISFGGLGTKDTEVAALWATLQDETERRIR